jgi:hypothetical protein
LSTSLASGAPGAIRGSPENGNVAVGVVGDRDPGRVVAVLAGDDGDQLALADR